jgi:hypothetical protein
MVYRAGFSGKGPSRRGGRRGRRSRGESGRRAPGTRRLSPAWGASSDSSNNGDGGDTSLGEPSPRRPYHLRLYILIRFEESLTPALLYSGFHQQRPSSRQQPFGWSLTKF